MTKGIMVSHSTIIPFKYFTEEVCYKSVFEANTIVPRCFVKSGILHLRRINVRVERKYEFPFKD